MFQFPASNVSLLASVELLARKLVNDIGEELDEGTDLLEWFCESHQENISEAGYSETRPNDRRSLRAFGRLLKVDPADKKRLRAETGYRRNEYREFVYLSLVLQAMSTQSQYAAGLKAAAGSLKSEGPFGKGNTLFLVPHLPALGHDYQMEVGDLPDTAEEFANIWLGHMVNEFKGVTELNDEDKSLVALASVIRVGDVNKLVNRLKKAGLSTDVELTLAVAHTVVNSLRLNRAFAYGVSCAQYEEVKLSEEAQTRDEE